MSSATSTEFGPEKILVVVGSVMGLLGAFLPFYRMEVQAFIGPVDWARVNQPAPNLIHAGAIGAIVILATITLGAIPFLALPTRTANLAGFGLATLVLGMVLNDFLRNSMFGRTFGAGFYSTLIGFAFLCYVYARRAYFGSS